MVTLAVSLSHRLFGSGFLMPAARDGQVTLGMGGSSRAWIQCWVQATAVKDTPVEQNIISNDGEVSNSVSDK